MRFLKLILGVHRYTSTDIVYGELGTYPIEIDIKCRKTNYWVSILTGNTTKFAYLIYQCLCGLYMSEIYKSQWVETIKTICLECGLSGLWLSQQASCPQYFRYITRRTLKDL